MNRFSSSLCAALALSTFSLTTLVGSSIVQAQVVTECDWLASAANILEPWEDNTVTFANGNIRLAVVDTGGEPVCCSAHLMVLSPSGNGADEPVYRQCRLASVRPGEGFYSINLSNVAARYDPGRGLSVSFETGHWHQGMETGAPPILDRMEILINQATGTVSVE